MMSSSQPLLPRTTRSATLKNLTYKQTKDPRFLPSNKRGVSNNTPTPVKSKPVDKKLENMDKNSPSAVPPTLETNAAVTNPPPQAESADITPLPVEPAADVPEPAEFVETTPPEPTGGPGTDGKGLQNQNSNNNPNSNPNPNLVVMMMVYCGASLVMC